MRLKKCGNYAPPLKISRYATGNNISVLQALTKVSVIFTAIIRTKAHAQQLLGQITVSINKELSVLASTA